MGYIKAQKVIDLIQGEQQKYF